MICFVSLPPQYPANPEVRHCQDPLPSARFNIQNNVGESCIEYCIWITKRVLINVPPDPPSQALLASQKVLRQGKTQDRAACKPMLKHHCEACVCSGCNGFLLHCLTPIVALQAPPLVRTARRPRQPLLHPPGRVNSSHYTAFYLHLHCITVQKEHQFTH